MRSIAELQTMQIAKNRGIATLTDAHTRIATTGITDMQPTKWVKEVINFAEDMRYLDQIVRVDKQMVGTKDESVTIPMTTSHLSITTAHTEGATRTKTEMDNMDTVTANITTSDFLSGVITVTKQLFMTCAIDLLKQARYAIAEDLSDDVDLAIATALQTTNLTANIVYGGDATQIEDITAGDVITTDLVADARRLIKVNSKCVPKWIAISSYQEATFLKDSQFVNASEYGSNQIVMKGEIGTYIGLKVIVTDNANLAYTDGDTEVNENASPGASCNICPVIGIKKGGERVSVGLAWKELPHIDYEYEKDESIHKIYYDQAFTTFEMFTQSWALIKVSQS